MSFLQFFGRLHPLVLHFTIALLLLAAAVEAVRCFRPDPHFARLTVTLLALGGFGALMAAGTGWVFARETHVEPLLRGTLLWHRWLGVSTAFLAVFAWIVARRWADDDRSSLLWISRLTIWATAALLVIAAHLGARLVWGADFFS